MLERKLLSIILDNNFDSSTKLFSDLNS